MNIQSKKQPHRLGPSPKRKTSNYNSTNEDPNYKGITLQNQHHMHPPISQNHSYSEVQNQSLISHSLPVSQLKGKHIEMKNDENQRTQVNSGASQLIILNNRKFLKSKTPQKENGRNISTQKKVCAPRSPVMINQQQFASSRENQLLRKIKILQNRITQLHREKHSYTLRINEQNQALKKELEYQRNSSDRKSVSSRNIQTPIKQIGRLQEDLSEKKIEGLKRQLNQAELQIKRENVRNMNLIKQNSLLQERLKNSENHFYKKQNESSSSSDKKLNQLCYEVRREGQWLNVDVSEIKTQQDKIHGLQQSLKSYENKVKAQSEEILKQQQELNRQKDFILNQEKIMQNQEALVTEHQVRLRKEKETQQILQQRLIKLQKEAQQLQRSMNEKQEQISIKRVQVQGYMLNIQEKDEKSKDLSAQTFCLNEQVGKLNQNIQKLEQELTEVRTTSFIQKESKKEVQEQYNSIVLKVNQLLNQNKELNSLNAEVEIFKKQMRKQLEEKEKEISCQREMIIEYETKIKENESQLEKVQESIKQLEQKFQKVFLQKQKISIQLNSYEQKFTSITFERDELKKVEQRVNFLSLENQRLKNELSEQNNRLMKLDKSHENERKESKDMSLKMISLQKQNKLLHHEVEQTSEKLVELTKEYEEMKSKNNQTVGCERCKELLEAIFKLNNQVNING